MYILPPFTFFKCAPKSYHFEYEIGMKKSFLEPQPAKHLIMTGLIMCFNLTGFSPAPKYSIQCNILSILEGLQEAHLKKVNRAFYLAFLERDIFARMKKNG